MVASVQHHGPTQDGRALVDWWMALCRPIRLAVVAVGPASCRVAACLSCAWSSAGGAGEAGRTGQRWPTRWPGGVSMPMSSLPVGPTGAPVGSACLSPPEPGPPCHWMPQQACHATRLGSGALGPEHDHAVAGGQVDLGAGVGERFPLARRMAGSSRTDQPKARLATASEDCSETAMGTTGPTMRRTPLRTSQGLPQLHKLPRRPNSKVTASG